MNYNRLKENLVDQIKEEQVKLGYRKEKIRFYYPLGTLRHLLETDADEAEMEEILAGFAEAEQADFGPTEVTRKKDRFCLILDEKASEYVHGQMKECEFIRELVQVVRKHGCTMQEIEELFRQTAENIVIREVNDGEFDFLIYFPDGEDPYYYCFKDEGCHIIYHRFLPADYRDIYEV